ncbi:unnamed protein product [Thlaspi arvense]|uniref:Zinc finger GRF-type domain-containing protein n=1 Tax=Thlaspi arvense TaxID=13288 RepID=A0AAU9RUZ3_THLAR|nr:unnamed protein product [Thlaspi arvense]
MSRIVEIREGMSILQLKVAVIKEFYPGGSDEVSAELTYWPPNSTEQVSRITTRPVLVTNYDGIKFFFKHFCITPSMNLFDSFAVDASNIGKDQINKDVRTTTNPPMLHEHASSFHKSLLSSRTSFAMKFCYLTPTTLSDLDDKEILDKVEQAEEEFLKTGQYVSEVRPVGYDSEFWDPLIHDPLGGSDAAEITCPASEGFDAKAAAMGKRKEYMCFTNDAFDHSVITGDIPPKHEDPWFPKSSTETGDTCNPDPPVPNEPGYVGARFSNNINSPSSNGISEARRTPGEQPHFQFNMWTSTNGQSEMDTNREPLPHRPPPTVPHVAKYLERIVMAHWSRVYCKGERSKIMTTIACEQLNNALTKGTGSRIVLLLTFIQEIMTKWFNARRRKSLRCRGNIPPKIDKLLTEHIKDVKGSKINAINDWTCQIVADSLQLSYSSLVGTEYQVTTWQDTYSSVVHPVEDAADEDIPPKVRKVLLFPPRSRRAAGRRKETCYLSAGEVSEDGILKECYFGARAIVDTCHSRMDPGRRFFMCPNVRDGDCHIRKWWDKGVMEELALIQSYYGLVAEMLEVVTFLEDFSEDT